MAQVWHGHPAVPVLDAARVIIKGGMPVAGRGSKDWAKIPVKPSRGRVAEWLKAPDSKLLLPPWTGFLPLGQKWRFRPISLGFYNFHLDMEGRRKTRFSTGSIQVEYTSGSIQVSPCHPQVASDFR